mgnify:FL=1
MPEVILNGPEGRIECMYSQGKESGCPVALILHPEPYQGGSMNNKVTYSLHQEFKNRGFSVLRFNFRGVGKSQGSFDNGEGELADAAAVLDWLQSQNLYSKFTFIAGFSFGSWIGMQLMMRRPEISGFICVSPPADKFDFAFLAPCPASGLIVHGRENNRVPFENIQSIVDRISKQKDVKIDIDFINDANHNFTNHLDDLMDVVKKYLNQRYDNFIDTFHEENFI